MNFSSLGGVSMAWWRVKAVLIHCRLVELVACGWNRMLVCGKVSRWMERKL